MVKHTPTSLTGARRTTWKASSTWAGRPSVSATLSCSPSTEQVGEGRMRATCNAVLRRTAYKQQQLIISSRWEVNMFIERRASKRGCFTSHYLWLRVCLGMSTVSCCQWLLPLSVLLMTASSLLSALISDADNSILTPPCAVSFLCRWRPRLQLRAPPITCRPAPTCW